MKRLTIFLTALLAGCGSQPGVTAANASASEVANKVAAAGSGSMFLAPGHWEGNIKITSVEMPGTSPQVAERMSRAMTRDRAIESCLTPEEAERPKGAFFGGDDENCRYEHFKMAGGMIDAAMVCRHEGTKRVTTMKGSYSPDSYQMAMTMKSEGGTGPGANMSMAMHITAARMGACTGMEAN